MKARIPNSLMTAASRGKDDIVVGVIADTHGVLVPAALKALKGVDLIIHAGDVGHPDVLDSLQTIAPVVAVRGNMDFDEGLRELPATEAIDVGDVLLYVIHNVHQLDIAPAESGFGAVIFGHSHQPSKAQHKGVLFLNPGSAAQPRFNSPASLALLHIRGISLKARFVDLDG